MRTQSEIIELVGKCAEAIEKVSGRDFSYAYDLEYDWNYKSKSMVAGRCKYLPNLSKKSALITLSPYFLDDDKKLKDTLTHEMLHAFCWIEYNCRGHKGVWKTLATALGLTRCHDYSVPKEIKRYSLYCPICKQEIRTSSRKLKLSNRWHTTCRSLYHRGPKDVYDSPGYLVLIDFGPVPAVPYFEDSVDLAARSNIEKDIRNMA